MYYIQAASKLLLIIKIFTFELCLQLEMTTGIIHACLNDLQKQSTISSSKRKVKVIMIQSNITFNTRRIAGVHSNKQEYRNYKRKYMRA